MTDLALGALIATTAAMALQLLLLGAGIVWVFGRKDVTVIKSAKGISVQASR